jgi:hypothetical protein
MVLLQILAVHSTKIRALIGPNWNKAATVPSFYNCRLLSYSLFA